jgi:hypothetical protein
MSDGRNLVLAPSPLEPSGALSISLASAMPCYVRRPPPAQLLAPPLEASRIQDVYDVSVVPLHLRPRQALEFASNYLLPRWIIL